MEPTNPIQLLDSLMINKIAAGEVVEKPASVVKELVENSIDAGATQITVEINDGIIRVSDNGSGIPKAQVATAFLRHATSKIATIDDLEQVLTMGFRGEAMAAISAVSKLQMTTQTRHEDMGTLIELEAGVVTKHQPVGAAVGTTVIVRGLFHNVPARLKFLKKPATETSYITDLIEKMCLANPHITFTYLTGGKKRSLGGKGLQHAIYQVYGKAYYQDLLALDTTDNRGELGVQGYLGKPTLHRPNRSYGNIFINSRYIKSKLIQKAIEAAYQTKLPINQFPIYALNLKLDPRIVDVNVHPTKLEVRFQNEDKIYDFMYTAVKTALENSAIIPEPQLVSKQLANGLTFGKLDKSDSPPELTETTDVAYPKPDLSANNLRMAEPAVQYVTEEFFDEALYTDYLGGMDLGALLYDEQPVTEPQQSKVVTQVQLNNQVVSTEVSPRHKLFQHPKIMGAAFDTYLMIEDEGELYLMDQHAAHERIWYDKLLTQIEQNQPLSQGLVVPVAVHLTPPEEAFLTEHLARFTHLGFEIDPVGQGGWAIRAVPFVFEQGIAASTFLVMLGDLKRLGSDIYDKHKVASMACKAAVKGGDKLSMAEMISLIAQLEQTTSPYTCPHGRPTVIKFTQYEIEKLFKRV